MLPDPLDNTVISIGALVLAFKSFESGIFGNFECNSVFHTEFLELSDHAIANIGDAWIKNELHLPSRQSIEALKISSLF